MATSRRIRRILYRGARLRCPRCGEATLFTGMFKMNGACSKCGLEFEREPGYFVGAIYINYAATAAVTIGGFLLVDNYTNLSLTVQMIIGGTAAVAFPLFFYRYSKSLWLAFDYIFNPEGPKLRVVRGRSA